MSWVSAVRTRLQLLFAPKAAERRMNDEIDFHIEMETERLMREQRLPQGEARRRALVAFGGVTQHKETLRDGRGLAWLGGMSLDFKLGFRMLRKYPGLTIVGGLALAFAIWVGAVVFEMVTLALNPTLPLPDGKRIVQIRNWDVQQNRSEYRTVHEFMLWRQTLTSITDVGAYRDVSRNLVASVGEPRPVEMAEMSASGFRIAPSRPLMGRVLGPDDERPGSPPVLVIGYDVWKNRFGSDPNVVGRSVQLGDAYVTIVGVMPEGFAFPAYHDAWVPLRAQLLEQAPRAGAEIRVFGRLAPGASRETAQAELATLGRRLASEFPATHQHLQPQVRPFTKIFFGGGGNETQWLMLSFNLFAIMFVALICSNVALLLFARAASREGEIVVRSALGASRGRIVMQLFAEALVLGGVAAVVGLLAADFGLERWGRPFLEENLGRLPFWYDLSLSPMTVLYAVALTAMAAAIAGALPGLKVTRGIGTRLKQGTAGGGGLQFGGVWTAVIVTQVAFTVAFPVVLYVERWELRRIQSFDVGFAAEQFLGVNVSMDYPVPTTGNADSAWRAHGERYGTALEALRQRLLTEPGVHGVTFVDQMPRMWHREELIELDDREAAAALAKEAAKDRKKTVCCDAGGAAVNEVSIAFIDPSYFSVLQTPILAGRAFNAGDHAPDGRVVIVDQAFVDKILQGRNAIGQRLRYAPERKNGQLIEGTRHWYEIIGVVKELGMASVAEQHRAAGLYFPTNLKNVGDLHMMVRVQGDPLAFASRVREITIAVDPTLRLSDLQRVSEISNGLQWLLGLWFRVSLVLTAVALLLSLAGIYAVLSFTVARRTREIGVRVALGASRQRLVAAIFRRPLTQVSIGVVVGTILVGVIAIAFSGGLSFIDVAMLVGYAALMFGVCMLACIVPTQRALGVEPMEALRAE